MDAKEELKTMLELKIATIESELKASGAIPHCIRCDAETEAYEIMVCDECMEEGKRRRAARNQRREQCRI